MLCTRCQKELEPIKRRSVGSDSVFIKNPKDKDGWESKPVFLMACRNCGLIEEFVQWENNDYKY